MKLAALLVPLSVATVLVSAQDAPRETPALSSASSTAYGRLDKISRESYDDSTYGRLDKISRERDDNSTYGRLDKITRESDKDSTYGRMDKVSRQSDDESTYGRLDKVTRTENAGPDAITLTWGSLLLIPVLNFVLL